MLPSRLAPKGKDISREERQSQCPSDAAYCPPDSFIGDGGGRGSRRRARYGGGGHKGRAVGAAELGTGAVGAGTGVGVAGRAQEEGKLQFAISMARIVRLTVAIGVPVGSRPRLRLRTWLGVRVRLSAAKSWDGREGAPKRLDSGIQRTLGVIVSGIVIVSLLQ
jgi:hypothetical protein